MSLRSFKRIRGQALKTLALVCCALLSACDSGESGSGPTAGVISVQLGWSLPSGFDATSGITFTNGAGYSIHLSSVMINTYSVELIPCDEELFRKLQEPRQRPKLSQGILINKAWAGHGDPTRPTRTGVVRPEWPMSQANPVFMDTLDPPDYDYCRVHYLVGRVPDTPMTQSSHADLIGLSMSIDGTYQAPGTPTAQPFQVRTSAAHGTLSDLAANGQGTGLRLREGDRLIVQRNFESLFNGVVFDAMADKEIARHILRNIVNGVSLEVVPNA